jgi:hypothetical protein
MIVFFLKDVVIMGAALEKAFYEYLADMPSDVRFVAKGIFNNEFD